jgi:hypothetical protein
MCYPSGSGMIDFPNFILHANPGKNKPGRAVRNRLDGMDQKYFLKYLRKTDFSGSRNVY